MKKNRMMRIASCLLVAVLLTTCAISGTFAKYVTQASATSTARVAKWGVTVEATGDVFKKAYTTNDPKAKDVIPNSVELKGSTEEKLVAPGTSGTLVACELSGSPEVAVHVSFDMTTFELTGWTVDGNEYCPIIFTVGNTKYYIGDGQSTNVATLITNVKAAVNDFSADYQPNTDLSTIASAFTLKWAWPFDSSSEAFVSANGQDDSKDTALGNFEVNSADAPTISFEMTVTVTQID